MIGDQKSSNQMFCSDSRSNWRKWMVGFLDEQPEIVEGIDEREFIVQEVTQLGMLFQWWGSQKELGKC